MSKIIIHKRSNLSYSQLIVPSILYIFVLLCCFIVYSRAEVSSSHFQHKRIAVIGSGAAGSSVAYFSRKYLGEEVDIEIFEKNKEIGGRVKDKRFHHAVVELGGSIYHSSNKLMSNWVKEANLTTYNPISTSDASRATQFEMGVWNGEEFLFETNNLNYYGSAKTLLNAFLRYGFTKYKIDSLSKDANHKFNQIYDLLDDENRVFHDVNELLDALQLSNLTTLSLYDYFRENSICDSESNRFYCDEIVNGLTRVNYGQSMEDINALAGLVALIGSGDSVFSVLGGNRLAFMHAIRSSNAHLRLNSKVISIRKMENNKYKIEYAKNDGKNHELIEFEIFDVVVIASPLEHSDIQFIDMTLPESALKVREFQRTFVTMVSGDIKLDDYFKRSAFDVVPNQILTTENKSLPFTSLFPKSYDGQEHFIYKFFSRSYLFDSFVDRVIKNRSDIYRTDFFAYPKLLPTSEFPPFILQNNLYYVNAFEFAFSTIESEIASGKNIAKLIRKYFSYDNY